MKGRTWRTQKQVPHPRPEASPPGPFAYPHPGTPTPPRQAGPHALRSPHPLPLRSQSHTPRTMRQPPTQALVQTQQEHPTTHQRRTSPLPQSPTRPRTPMPGMRERRQPRSRSHHRDRRRRIQARGRERPDALPRPPRTEDPRRETSAPTGRTAPGRGVLIAAPGRRSATAAAFRKTSQIVRAP